MRIGTPLKGRTETCQWAKLLGGLVAPSCLNADWFLDLIASASCHGEVGKASLNAVSLARIHMKC